MRFPMYRGFFGPRRTMSPPYMTSVMPPPYMTGSPFMAYGTSPMVGSVYPSVMSGPGVGSLILGPYRSISGITPGLAPAMSVDGLSAVRGGGITGLGPATVYIGTGTGTVGITGSGLPIARGGDAIAGVTGASDLGLRTVGATGPVMGPVVSTGGGGFTYAGSDIGLGTASLGTVGPTVVPVMSTGGLDARGVVMTGGSGSATLGSGGSPLRPVVAPGGYAVGGVGALAVGGTGITGLGTAGGTAIRNGLGPAAGYNTLNGFGSVTNGVVATAPGFSPIGGGGSATGGRYLNAGAFNGVPYGPGEEAMFLNAGGMAGGSTGIGPAGSRATGGLGRADVTYDSVSTASGSASRDVSGSITGSGSFTSQPIGSGFVDLHGGQGQAGGMVVDVSVGGGAGSAADLGTEPGTRIDPNDNIGAGGFQNYLNSGPLQDLGIGPPAAEPNVINGNSPGQSIMTADTLPGLK